MKTYIVTVTAADQVGIVHAVTGTVTQWGGNVLELSQTVLRGYFTIILAVEFPEAIDPEALTKAVVEQGARFGLTVQVITADLNRGSPVADGERFILTVLGADRPGNIHAIAGCLAEHGVNIVDLHARAEGPRFSLVMEAFLPPDLPPGTVRAELERFGKDRELEAFVQHENIFLATTEPSPVRVDVGRWRRDAIALRSRATQHDVARQSRQRPRRRSTRRERRACDRGAASPVNRAKDHTLRRASPSPVHRASSLFGPAFTPGRAAQQGQSTRKDNNRRGDIAGCVPSAPTHLFSTLAQSRSGQPRKRCVCADGTHPTRYSHPMRCCFSNSQHVSGLMK